MYEVAPFGERRADIRAAVMTANLLVMQAANKQEISEDEFRQVVSGLMQYLPDEEDQEDAADLEALKRLRKQGE